MSGVVVTWQAQLRLGPCVVAIGVFDGVHAGHRELLTCAVADAHARGVSSVALTFDRDPDQIVSPATAAPQLLTLEDKCRFLLETGVDVVLVVPFTPELSRMPAEVFLQAFLSSCCVVQALHVGADFRFGAKAEGDASTLKAWAEANGAEMHPHALLHVDGAPVTSTRIRGLVAAGDVEGATTLLGRAPRMTGEVVEGRKQGRLLGFPTANVTPVPHAALPADGVYAGRAVLADGSVYPAAISVGVPPTFPEARDYVEAHLIGFEGDLYGQALTLEFVARLRSQQAFGSLEELTEAIRADVAQAAALGGETGSVVPKSDAFHDHDASAPEPDTTRLERENEEPADDSWDPNPFTAIAHNVGKAFGFEEFSTDVLDDGEPVVADQAALEAAERAVARIDSTASYEDATEEWAILLSKRHLSGIFGDAGSTAALVVAPLVAQGIPHAWDPYPPEQMPSMRPYYGVFDRPFSLMVPESRLEEAKAVMQEAYPAIRW